MITIEERKERKKQRQQEKGRLYEGVLSEDAILVKDICRDAFDLSVDLALLDGKEAPELVSLAKRVRTSEEVTVPGDPADRVEAFAAKAVELAEGMSGDAKARAGALAQFARDSGRLPTSEDRTRILNGESVPVFRAGTVEQVARGINLRALKDGELRRFEELVEIAAGTPGLLQERRKGQKLRTEVAKLHSALRPGPRQRVRVDEAGSVWLPRAIWKDLQMTSHGGYRLNLQAVSVFVDVLFMFANRELPVGVPTYFAELVDDEAALLVQQHGSPIGMHDIGGPGERSGIEWKWSLRDLEMCGWLKSEPTPQGTKVTLGPSYEKALAEREEIK